MADRWHRDPFAAFVMSEFHEDYVRERVEREEREAIPGQVPCPSGSHGDERGGEMLPGALPCLTCGAAL